jgi:hypothetical protein
VGDTIVMKSDCESGVKKLKLELCGSLLHAEAWDMWKLRLEKSDSRLFLEGCEEIRGCENSR